MKAMDFGIITELIGVVLGGGLGALIMQAYTAKVSKRKLVTEVEEAEVDIERKKQDNRQDAFDTMYSELNKCMADYAAISEEYREHRERARKYEEAVQEQIQAKCSELASLKSKILYLKGIRCYNTLCQNRVRSNPDKEHIEPGIDEPERTATN